MGYMLCMSNCYACGRYFGFNPERVPSITPPGKSSREPICRDCVEAVNPKRVANGLPPIAILPGAYEAEEVA